MNLQKRATGPRETCGQPSPIHPDHATLPIRESFDWARCLQGIPFSRLYLVVFRSVRRLSADLDVLKAHDDAAYLEAHGSGGLLHYFKGEANERRECLSFCLWESRDDALKATGLPAHRAAALISAEMYESYELERYDVRKNHAPDGEAVVFERLPAVGPRPGNVEDGMAGFERPPAG